MLVTTLTKRMAEDLTEYLDEHDVRVRYLHSDIETVERVEIIRDLRLGEFDVLVGINLLREGLDMPEVSLVAILDADKEGFLRSERSLIQTIGPRGAQRQRQGNSVRRPDDRLHGAGHRRDRTPPGQAGRLQRGARHHPADHPQGGGGCHGRGPRRAGASARRYARVAEEVASTPGCHRRCWPERSRKLEKQMYQHAQNLEFEDAARLRDQIRHIQESNLGIVERGGG